MRSGKGVLLLAIALGLATSFGVWYYVEQRTTAEARPIRMVPVVVATTYIPPRTILSGDHVRLTEVPQEARLTDALVDLIAALGKVTKIALTTNEQVIGPKLFAERKESGLAFVVPPGRRAVAVAISETIGSGGMIVPGDHVDVIGLLEVRHNGQESVPMAVTLLQDIEVLAVAQLLEGDDPRPTTTARVTQAITGAAGLGKTTGTADGAASARANPVPQPQAKSVTLAVTPEEAQRLTLGEQFGELRLSLRPYGEHQIVPLGTFLLPGLDAAPPAPPAKR